MNLEPSIPPPLIEIANLAIVFVLIKNRIDYPELLIGLLDALHYTSDKKCQIQDCYAYQNSQYHHFSSLYVLPLSKLIKNLFLLTVMPFLKISSGSLPRWIHSAPVAGFFS